MKAYYETSRESVKTVSAHRNVNHTYKAHFHSHIELLLVNKGAIPVTCNGKSYVVKEGQIAFFNSYDIHEYEPYRLDGQDNCVVILPTRFCDKFLSKNKNLCVKEPIIENKELTSGLLEIVDRIIIPYAEGGVEDVVHAGVDLLLSLVEKHLELEENTQKYQHDLIKDILDILDNEYKTDLSLPIIAEKLGYTVAHVSRTFHQYVKQSLNEYVNDLRITYIENQLQTGTDKKITELIYSAGFKSVQTYYRNLARYKKNNTKD